MAKARKEIDKDSMYQKIMPSAMRSAPATDEVEPVAAPAKKTTTRSTPRKAPAKTTPPPTERPVEMEKVAMEPEAPVTPTPKVTATPPRKPA